MDVNFINPVVKSILSIMSTMARLNPTPGTPQKKDPYELVRGKNITGLISMIGSQAIASVAITYSEEAIVHIARNMLPPTAEINCITPMVIDLAGELANMALGGAKSDLEEKGYLFQLSLPTIIVGSDYIIAHRAKAPIIMLPFTMPEGNFFVEASYEDIGPAPARR